MEDLFDLKNGYTPSKNNSEFWEGEANIPWFRMEDIRENGRILYDSTQHITEKGVKGELFPADSIIISTSATIGEHALIKVPSLSNQRFTYLVFKDTVRQSVDIKYIFYYCFKFGDYCREHLNQGNFASVDMDAFKRFMFILPSIERQKEIVSILDRFEKLCNDTNEGLPAEIRARYRQYEYYRDKILTFKEKKQKGDVYA